MVFLVLFINKALGVSLGWMADALAGFTTVGHALHCADHQVHAIVRAALGIMKCVVSGGGSLAAHLDDFYEAAGLPVLVRMLCGISLPLFFYVRDLDL